METTTLSDGQKAKWISALAEEGGRTGWPVDARQELILALSEDGCSTAAMENWSALWNAVACWARLGDASHSFGLSKIMERIDGRFSGIGVAAAREIGNLREDPSVSIEAAKLLSGRRLELRELCRSAAGWMRVESFAALARAVRSAGYDPVRGVGGSETLSVLTYAARGGNVEVGKWLLAQGASCGSVELFAALSAGSVQFALAIECKGLWTARANLVMMTGIDVGESAGRPKAGMGLAALLGASASCVELALARGAWPTDDLMREDAATAWRLGAGRADAGIRKGVLDLVRLIGPQKAEALADRVARGSTDSAELSAFAESMVLAEFGAREIKAEESKRL